MLPDGGYLSRCSVGKHVVGALLGWDPKEVWALITLLVYAFPLHSRMLPFFRRPRVFYLYCVLAFGAVLFTYFGVNFLLGGMHAYQ